MDNTQQPLPENPQPEKVNDAGSTPYRVPDAKLDPPAPQAAPQPQPGYQIPQGQPQPGPHYQHQAAPPHANPQYGGFPPPPPPRRDYQPAAPKISIFKDGDPSVKTVVAFALAIVSLGGLFSRYLAFYNLIVAIVALVMVIGENKIKQTRLGNITFIISLVSLGLKILSLVACVACLACVGCGSGAATDIFQEFGNFR